MLQYRERIVSLKCYQIAENIEEYANTYSEMNKDRAELSVLFFVSVGNNDRNNAEPINV